MAKIVLCRSTNIRKPTKLPTQIRILCRKELDGININFKESIEREAEIKKCNVISKLQWKGNFHYKELSLYGICKLYSSINRRQIITGYLRSKLLDGFAKQLTSINCIYEFPKAENVISIPIPIPVYSEQIIYQAS